MTDPPAPGHQDAGGPPATIRIIGQAITSSVARAPWLWPLLRRPVRRFFDRLAPGWDTRVGPDSPERRSALVTALQHLDAPPARVLDLGTGTGSAALFLAEHYPTAEVVGVDISEPMIEAARAKVGPDLRSCLRFEVGDAAALPYEAASFDLVVQINVPVFFDTVARLLGSGGHAIVISSFGAATPFYTPIATLRRGFERRGIREVAHGPAGTGEFFIAGLR